MQPQKILVKGPALSRSGYGEQTRFALQALRSRPDLFDIYIINIGWGRTGHITDNRELTSWIRDTIHKTLQALGPESPLFQPDLSLQVTIPSEFEKIAPVNIGYTAAVETTKISADWIARSKETVDKILTISEHSKRVLVSTAYTIENPDTGDTIENFSIDCPVQVVSYPVRDFEPEALDIEFSTTKNFLALSQWGPRKNMENTISGFIQEFRHDEDVGLVLKTNLMADSMVDRHHTSRRLENFLKALNISDRKCKIYLLHGELTPGNLTWLYRHPTMKALVNIAHGEGFGLPLFEAAYNGLPLVTITWGGQLDFITKKNKKGKRVPRVSRVDFDIAPVHENHVWEGVIEKDSMWAYAKLAPYKRALREILTKETHYKKEAEVLKNHIHAEFSMDKMLENFVNAVYTPPDEAVQEWLDKIDEMQTL